VIAYLIEPLGHILGIFDPATALMLPYQAFASSVYQLSSSSITASYVAVRFRLSSCLVTLLTFERSYYRFWLPILHVCEHPLSLHRS
jgi:hypothetical protein